MLDRILDGRYRIISQLGKGGFGETYLAKDIRRMERQCVVKLLQPISKDPHTLREAKLLFESEARTLANLGQNDQIPDLLDYFEENQEFYLVQELVEGNSLNREITRFQGMPEAEVINILLDVLNVLSYVHQCQVIHRDIKPTNLMRRHKDRKIVLIDFGAVKQVHTQYVNSQGQTAFSRVIGTAGYMPNEQAGGKPRFSSDIYALGMTAIEALTGKPPNQLQEDPRTGEVIWRNQANVSPKLADILDKMVRSHWTERYQSADEVLQDIHNLQLGARQSSKPSGAPQEPKVNKNLLIGGAITLLGFGGLAGIGYLGSGNNSQPIATTQTSQPVPTTIETTQPVPTPVQTTPSEKNAEDFLKQGLEKYNKRDFQGAISDYNQAIQINPNYASAYFNRGLVRSATGDKQGAISDYTSAIRINPNDAKAYNNRGVVRNQLGDKQAAISDYTSAIRINPNYDKSYNNRGLVRYELGDKQAAISDYTSAIRINPNHAKAYYNRGNARNDLGDKQAAISDYTSAIRINPNYADAYFNGGNARNDLGDKQRAIANYQKAAELYQQQGNTKDYQKALDRIKELQ